MFFGFSMIFYFTKIFTKGYSAVYNGNSIFNMSPQDLISLPLSLTLRILEFAHKRWYNIPLRTIKEPCDLWAESIQ